MNSSSIYQSLFENTTQITLLVRPQGYTILDANSAACSFYGYTKEEMKEKNLLELVAKNSIQTVIDQVSLLTPSHFCCEHRLVNQEVKESEMFINLVDINEEKLVHITVSSACCSLQAPVHGACKRWNMKQCAEMQLHHNQEQYKQSLQELQAYVQKEEKIINELREYDQLKTQFFSNISHELKTPLNIILGGIQLLDIISKDPIEHIDQQKIKRYISMMKQNCFRLLRLINNLIDITRYDVGFIKMSYGNYNIVNIVEDITLSVAEYANSKNIKLIFDTEIEEKILACDVDQIERVILNLLSNAMKFTDSGGQIGVSIYEFENTIKISVKDTGMGIPQNMLSSIFERFKQVDSSLSRRVGGSGIGLSLVKAIIESHGGRISVQSKEDQGSEFIIELPVKLIEETPSLCHQLEANMQSNVERICIEFSDIYAPNESQE